MSVVVKRDCSCTRRNNEYREVCTSAADMNSKIKTLEARIADLEENNGELETRSHKLENALNQVRDEKE